MHGKDCCNGNCECQGHHEMDPMQGLVLAAEEAWMELFYEKMKKKLNATHGKNIDKMVDEAVKKMDEKWKDKK